MICPICIISHILLLSKLYYLIFYIFITIKVSVPAYGFSLYNEERCDGCHGGGKRDAVAEAREGTGEAESRVIFDFRGRYPQQG